MTIAEQIYEKVKTLPPEKQAKVLDFAESMKEGEATPVATPRKSIIGALAHLNLDVSEEDIAEMRREMWGNFPRDFPE